MRSKWGSMKSIRGSYQGLHQIYIWFLVGATSMGGAPRPVGLRPSSLNKMHKLITMCLPCVSIFRLSLPAHQAIEIAEGIHVIYQGIHVVLSISKGGSMKSMEEIFKGIHEIHMGVHVIYKANL